MNLVPVSRTELNPWPKAGISTLRPNSDNSPVIASRMNDPASIQWAKRSIALNRVTVRPAIPSSTRTRPRNRKNTARMASVPSSSQPP